MRTFFNNRNITLIIGFIGVWVYAYIAFLYQNEGGGDQFGNFVYNYYYMSMLQGRLDVPAQIIGYEGHYLADGRAFVYHGIAPIITRVLADPFVDLTKVSMAPFTVWLFATGGTLVYHSMFYRVYKQINADGTHKSRGLYLLMSLLIWFVSPGLFIAANDSLYHEPIAVAYFTFACSFALIVCTAFGERNWGKIIVPLSILAGVTIFARPHIAIGLYFGVLVLVAYLLMSQKRKAVPGIILAMFFLGICGAVLLLLNYVRFENILTMHGDVWRLNETPGQLEIGHVFFEDVSHEPVFAIAEETYGQFNLRRVLPNLILYLVDLPRVATTGLYGDVWQLLHDTYKSWTASVGRIRNESPNLGIIWLWLPWFLLAAFGLAARKKSPKGLRLILLISTVILLLVCSFGTITFRYRFELWPMVLVMFFCALPGLVHLLKNRPIFSAVWASMVWGVVFIAAFINITLAATYGGWFEQEGDGSSWSFAQCERIVKNSSRLSGDDVPRICTLK